MMNTSADQTLSDAMLTDPTEGGGASITGSKAPLRAREDGSPAKPEAQRTKVRAQRCSFLTTPWECFRRHRDDKRSFCKVCIKRCSDGMFRVRAQTRHHSAAWACLFVEYFAHTATKQRGRQLNKQTFFEYGT